MSNNPLRRSLFVTTMLAALMLFVTACTSTDVAPVDVDTGTNSSSVQNDNTAQKEPEIVAEKMVVEAKLNLNTVAGDELLDTIPGFGNRMVREFHEYRPYISIQQFRREIGKYVDDAQVADYEQYVFVPVNVNESDAQTVMQIPGIDEALAGSLIAARPYDSNAAFIEKLTEFIPASEVAIAEQLLESE